MDIDARAATGDAARVHLGELLVALALLAGVMAATFAALDAGQRAYAVGAARVETQQSARIALARMAAEIRSAGFGGTEARFAAILVAEPRRIVVQRDLDGDGAIAGGGETVTWRLAGSVLRRDAGGGAQPVVNGVRDLQLTYRDADGAPTAARGEIHAVDIVLVTSPAQPGPAAGTTATVATTVQLRNR